MSASTIANVVKSIALNKLGVVQPPSFVTYFVTWACNHRCVFCDVWKKTPKDEMSLDEVKAVFRQLKSIDVLRISGGEPFLRKDLADIVNFIDETNKPSVIYFTTNGVMPRRILQTVEAIKSKHKVHVNVSIDDVGAKHDEVRGVQGAYEKALETVRGLVEMRERYGIHVGVNQAIVGEKSIAAYDDLRRILGELDVPVHPCVAYDSSSTIYSEDPTKQGVVDVESTDRPFGEWSDGALDKFLRRVVREKRNLKDFRERLVDTYFTNGLYDRLVRHERGAGPQCVTLNNHMRLLPNGDVPICLHNGAVVGNLRSQSFEEVWYGPQIKPHREWVAKCPGCWVGCETNISAIYTGDIWKGLLPKSLPAESDV
jgi:MoaA/NifB/PqqE/SkfB family radical SAM enzyme